MSDRCCSSPSWCLLQHSITSFCILPFIWSPAFVRRGTWSEYSIWRKIWSIFRYRLRGTAGNHQKVHMYVTIGLRRKRTWNLWWPLFFRPLTILLDFLNFPTTTWSSYESLISFFFLGFVHHVSWVPLPSPPRHSQDHCPPTGMEWFSVTSALLMNQVSSWAEKDRSC